MALVVYFGDDTTVVQTQAARETAQYTPVLCIPIGWKGDLEDEGTLIHEHGPQDCGDKFITFVNLKVILAGPNCPESIQLQQSKLKENCRRVIADRVEGSYVLDLAGVLSAFLVQVLKKGYHSVAEYDSRGSYQLQLVMPFSADQQEDREFHAGLRKRIMDTCSRYGRVFSSV